MECRFKYVGWTIVSVFLGLEKHQLYSIHNYKLQNYESHRETCGTEIKMNS